MIQNMYVALEKNAESNSKGTDYAEVDKRIMTVKDEVPISVIDKSQIGKTVQHQHQGSCLHYQGRVF